MRGLTRGLAAKFMRFLLIATAALFFVAPTAHAKPPTLTGLFPPGAARGQTATITASGTFDHWPVKAWTDFPGLEITAGADKGKLSVRVADDARPGVRWVRLYDEEDATDLRPFFVGTLPEILDIEPNDDPNRPQVISPPSGTVNGRLSKGGDVDGFAVTLSKGQTLVADLEANRHLNSPMDGVLQIATASGLVLAQNDDTNGRDPRIVFEAPAEGTYLVRVFAFPATPDSGIRFAGGDAFIYRLTLTTGGFLDHVFPLAAYKDGRGMVEAVGSNLPEAARQLPLNCSDDDLDLFRVFHPLLTGTTDVRRVSEQVVCEAEPDDFAKPQEISDRAAVSGRIDPKGDRDAFKLVLKKGDKRLIRVESRTLGFPLDPVLRVFGSDGKILAEADDKGAARDPELSFTAPNDGEYRVVVRDLNGNGGPRFVYLLTVVVPEPDFTLTLKSDKVDVSPSKPAKLTVTVERKEGFAAPIEIVAEGLPAGITAIPVTSKPGDDSAKSVSIELKATGQASGGPFRLLGKAQSGRPRIHAVRAPIAGFDTKTDHPWITIRDAPEPSKK